MCVNVKSVYTLLLWLAAIAIIGGPAAELNRRTPSQHEAVREANTENPNVTKSPMTTRAYPMTQRAKTRQIGWA